MAGQGQNRDTEYTKKREQMFILTMIIRHQAEPTICSHFGCGRHLSAREALFSQKCSAHQSGAQTIGSKAREVQP